MEEKEKEMVDIIKDLQTNESIILGRERLERDRVNALQNHVYDIEDELMNTRKNSELLTSQLNNVCTEFQTENEISETLRKELKDMKLAYNEQTEKLKNLDYRGINDQKMHENLKNENENFKMENENLKNEFNDIKNLLEHERSVLDNERNERYVYVYICICLLYILFNIFILSIYMYIYMYA
jgi:chromosome segregation ATPase